MVAIRTFALALAALAAGITAETVHGNTGHIDEHAEPTAMVPRDETCAEPPTLCTGQVVMYGYATTLTYLCTDAAAPTTIHVTVTKATTVTPIVTPSATEAVPVVDSALTSSAEPTTTTTVSSTSTVTKTITLVANTETIAAPAIPITDKFSVTIPAELTPQPTVHTDPSSSAEESRFTVQTSTPESRFTVQTTTPLVSEFRFTVQTSTPVLTTAFPSLTLPVENGTTSGIFYTHSMLNSSMVMFNSSMVMGGSSVARPTPLFPNTTAHKHYATPTMKMAQAAETSTEMNGAVDGGNGKNALLTGLLGSLMVAALIV